MDNSIRYIINYYNYIILGTPFDFDKVPPLVMLIIGEINTTLSRYVNLDTLFDNGGLLTAYNAIDTDLNDLLSSVKRNNKRFYNTMVLDQPIALIPRFKTPIVQLFYTNLSVVGKGSLDYGISSNRFVFNALKDAEENKYPTIQQFVRPSVDSSLSDQNIFLLIQFLGKIISSLIYFSEMVSFSEKSLVLSLDFNFAPSHWLKKSTKFHHVLKLAHKTGFFF